MASTLRQRDPGNPLALIRRSDRRALEAMAEIGKVEVAALAAVLIERHLAVVRETRACLDGSLLQTAVRDARGRSRP